MTRRDLSALITPEMKRQFHAEVADHLDTFERMLMTLEAEPAHPEAIASAFRAVHSVKGNSDYLGLRDMTSLAHDLEDLMDAVRGGELPVTEAIVEVCLEALDRLRAMNDGVLSETYVETDVSGLLERMERTGQEAAVRPPGFPKLWKPRGSEAAGAPARPEPGRADPPGAPQGMASVAETFDRELRVAPERVDGFINRIAELAIAKNTLIEMVDHLDAPGGAAAVRSGLKLAAAGIDRIAAELSGDVMRLRLVRMRLLFERLPRIIRDLSHDSGKSVRLITKGEAVEIDRKVIEQVADPVVHIIRNAMDHGIETPERRRRAGKPETGTIRVSARQEGPRVVIEVRDDGAGIDPEAVRTAAARKELVAPAELDRMSPAECLDLVFLPGMSTAASASRTSGRGVGLDVVRSNLRLIGGNVTVASTPGDGCAIRLAVPLTVAITDALLAEADGTVYALPISSVMRTLRVRRDAIRTLNGRERIAPDGSPLMLAPLADILNRRPVRSLRRGDPSGEVPIIVIRMGRRQLGLAVERIIRWEGILTRPLGPFFRGIQIISGASLLGDGRIVLVVDPIRVLEDPGTD